MSAATVPVALVEALEEGRVEPGALILMPAFGGGLTWCSHLVRWGERTAPLAESTSDCRRATRARSTWSAMRSWRAIEPPDAPPRV